MVRGGVDGLQMLVVRPREQPVAGLLGLALVRPCVAPSADLDVDV